MSALANKLPQFAPYVGLWGRVRHFGLLIFCIAALVFLMAPVLVIIPLAFNADPYLSRGVSSGSSSFSLTKCGKQR